jgi:D-serine deaminase-like pyridoxal phosphate-dependent protein
MKRRTLLLGGTGAAVGAGLIWKPGDEGAPHNPYFSSLNELLRTSGPGRPVMLIDLDRMNHNIDLLSKSVGPEKTYRIVVKSLPSVELVRHVMKRANTNALMLFHQPFINIIAELIPHSDVLIGKPMPVTAARTFYKRFSTSDSRFNPETQLQWLIDSPERLAQYQQMAKQLGIRVKVNLELDVGLHRGGIPEPAAIKPLLQTILNDPSHLTLGGFMGYEPHLSGMEATIDHDEVKSVLSIYQEFINEAESAGFKRDQLTLNGAGSHTLRIYETDNTMNDLSAGSGVVKPMDFDTYHLVENEPALFIATPILKRYDSLQLPLVPALGKLLSAWDPNRERLYYIYGGYWKAKMVSPEGTPDAIFHSTNQEPVSTSSSVDLEVDDYMFLRPTQSEHVMLQFGDLLVIQDSKIVNRWPVFQQTS